MRFACWINTHSEYVIDYLLLSEGNRGCTNVSQCYVIRKLPVLFMSYEFLYKIGISASLSKLDVHYRFQNHRSRQLQTIPFNGFKREGSMRAAAVTRI